MRSGGSPMTQETSSHGDGKMEFFFAGRRVGEMGCWIEVRFWYKIFPKSTNMFDCIWSTICLKMEIKEQIKKYVPIPAPFLSLVIVGIFHAPSKSCEHPIDCAVGSLEAPGKEQSHAIIKCVAKRQTYSAPVSKYQSTTPNTIRNLTFWEVHLWKCSWDSASSSSWKATGHLSWQWIEWENHLWMVVQSPFSQESFSMVWILRSFWPWPLSIWQSVVMDFLHFSQFSVEVLHGPTDVPRRTSFRSHPPLRTVTSRSSRATWPQLRFRGSMLFPHWPSWGFPARHGGTPKNQCFAMEHPIKIDWLVVWNINFIFPYIGNVIIPIDSYFSEGWPNHQPALK